MLIEHISHHSLFPSLNGSWNGTSSLRLKPKATYDPACTFAPYHTPITMVGTKKRKNVGFLLNLNKIAYAKCKWIRASNSKLNHMWCLYSIVYYFMFCIFLANQVRVSSVLVD